MNLSIKRLAAAAAGALLVASLGVAGTASAAHAADLPVLDATRNQMAHVCTRIADDGTQSGVICADIITGTDSTGFWAKAQVESFCESDPSGPVIHCPATENVYGLYNSARAGDPGNWEYMDGCGSWTNAFDGTITYGSPCGGNGQRNYFQTAELHWPLGTPCTPNEGNASTAVWSDVFGVSIPESVLHTGIVLPNDPTNLWTLGDSFSGLLNTGHYEICD